MPDFGTGRLLIVEDDDLVARAYARSLRASGHGVITTSDGGTAIELLGSGEYDAILADIAMPGMDGMELLRRIRKQDLDVPVVLMTGGPTLETAVKAVEYGALRYLVKPIAAAELQKVAGQAVRIGRVARLKREALLRSGRDGQTPADLAGLEARLASALGSLWVAFQPIVSLTRQRIFAFEALARTRERAFPHPEALFDAAQRLGRLHALGRRIREITASCSERLPAEAALFVNVHPLDLMDDDLHARDAPLSRHAARVFLEITERVHLDGVTDLRPRIESLRGMGFRIVLDDLGQGFAGLTSLARLQPDVVKLDMSLLRGVDTDHTQQVLVRSMATLAREMGMLLVAEGIETPAERDTAAELGCDLMQGYLFARPAPIEDLA